MSTAVRKRTSATSNGATKSSKIVEESNISPRRVNMTSALTAAADALRRSPLPSTITEKETFFVAISSSALVDEVQGITAGIITRGEDTDTSASIFLRSVTADPLADKLESLSIRSNRTDLVSSSAAKADVQSHLPRAVSQLDGAPFRHHINLTDENIRDFLALLPNQEMIFFDTETTGITKQDRIIEVAFVYRNYQTMTEKRWYSLVNPQGRRSSTVAYNAHKISGQELRDQPRFSELLADMQAFIGPEIPLVAHNAAFDRRILNYELARLTHSDMPKKRFHCTYQMARKINGNVKGVNALSALCEQYGVDLSSRSECHGAMQDSLLLAEVYPFILIATNS